MKVINEMIKELEFNIETGDIIQIDDDYFVYGATDYKKFNLIDLNDGCIWGDNRDREEMDEEFENIKSRWNMKIYKQNEFELVLRPKQ